MMEEESTAAATGTTQTTTETTTETTTPKEKAKEAVPVATLEVKTKSNEVDAKSALSNLTKKTETKDDGGLDGMVSSWFTSFTSAVADVADTGLGLVESISDNATNMADSIAQKSGEVDMSNIVTAGKAASETFNKVSQDVFDTTRLAAENGLTAAFDATSTTFAALNNNDSSDVAGIEILVNSKNPDVLVAVNSAITLRFGKSARVRGENISTPSAVQLVGLDAAKAVSKSILEALASDEDIHTQPTSQKKSNVVKVNPNELVLTIQDYIEEVTPGVSWVEINLLTLQDATNSIEIELLSQSVQVPMRYIDAARSKTASDYKFAEGGFGHRVGSMMKEDNSRVDENNWYMAQADVSKQEILMFATKILMSQYRNRLIDAATQSI